MWFKWVMTLGGYLIPVKRITGVIYPKIHDRALGVGAGSSGHRRRRRRVLPTAVDHAFAMPFAPPPTSCCWSPYVIPGNAVCSRTGR